MPRFYEVGDGVTGECLVIPTDKADTFKPLRAFFLMAPSRTAARHYLLWCVAHALTGHTEHPENPTPSKTVKCLDRLRRTVEWQHHRVELEDAERTIRNLITEAPALLNP